MTLKMNLSVDSLFAVTVATTAGAVLAMIAAPLWSRTRRARRMAMVDVALASSYMGTPGGAGEPVPIRPLEADAMPAELQSSTDMTAEPTAVVGEVLRADAHRTLLDAAGFEAIVHQEDAREERYQRPTTVVMMELDGLDRLIERLGEAAGGRVEPDVADTIAKLARRADYVARLSPGRFAVLMPETDEIVAINYVERIRQACDEWLASGAIAMCLAIGWSSTAGKASVTTAMQVAVDRMHAELRRGSRAADVSGDAPAA
jgi:diguanylate cyclase (GGDEF)-like protein